MVQNLTLHCVYRTLSNCVLCREVHYIASYLGESIIRGSTAKPKLIVKIRTSNYYFKKSTEQVKYNAISFYWFLCLFAGNRNDQRLSICHCSDTYIWVGDALHMSSTGRYRPRVNKAHEQLWDRVICHPHMWRHVWTGWSWEKGLSKRRHLEQDWAKVQTYVFMYKHTTVQVASYVYTYIYYLHTFFYIFYNSLSVFGTH